MKRVTLKVDTLDQGLEIHNGRLHVGCQQISKDDALKIAKFIHDADFGPIVMLGVWYNTEMGDRIFMKFEGKYVAFNRLGKSTCNGSLEGILRSYDNLKEL